MTYMPETAEVLAVVMPPAAAEALVVAQRLMGSAKQRQSKMRMEVSPVVGDLLAITQGSQEMAATVILKFGNGANHENSNFRHK